MIQTLRAMVAPHRGREGATAIEYLLLAAVVGIVIIAALLALSGALDGVWVWMSGEVEDAI